MTDLRIVVAGGGIAGLTAALALARRGHRVTVAERAQEFAEVGAGLQLSANATHVLAGLGLIDRVRQVGRAPEAVCLHDGVTGQALARVPMGAVSAARYGAPHLSVHRADLLDILLCAATEAGVECLTNARIVSADAASAEATLADGRKLSGDVLVGADGVRSTLRQSLFDPAPPRFTGHVAWRALVPRDPGDITRNWMLPGRHVVTYPLRHGAAALTNVVAVEETGTRAEEGWQGVGDPAKFLSRFADAASALRRLLEGAGEVRQWGLFAHAPADWVRDRTVLIGDAAHPTLPYLAQGAGMAIEDGWLLAQALDAGPGGLAGFARDRRARTDRITAESFASGRIYHHRGFMRLARNAVLRATPGRLLLRRLDWLYGFDATSSTQTGT